MFLSKNLLNDNFPRPCFTKNNLSKFHFKASKMLIKYYKIIDRNVTISKKRTILFLGRNLLRFTKPVVNILVFHKKMEQTTWRSIFWLLRKLKNWEGFFQGNFFIYCCANAAVSNNGCKRNMQTHTRKKFVSAKNQYWIKLKYECEDAIISMLCYKTQLSLSIKISFEVSLLLKNNEYQPEVKIFSLIFFALIAYRPFSWKVNLNKNTTSWSPILSQRVLKFSLISFLAKKNDYLTKFDPKTTLYWAKHPPSTIHHTNVGSGRCASSWLQDMIWPLKKKIEIDVCENPKISKSAVPVSLHH